MDTKIFIIMKALSILAKKRYGYVHFDSKKTNCRFNCSNNYDRKSIVLYKTNFVLSIHRRLFSPTQHVLNLKCLLIMSSRMKLLRVGEYL